MYLKSLVTLFSDSKTTTITHNSLHGIKKTKDIRSIGSDKFEEIINQTAWHGLVPCSWYRLIEADSVNSALSQRTSRSFRRNDESHYFNDNYDAFVTKDVKEFVRQLSLHKDLGMFAPPLEFVFHAKINGDIMRFHVVKRIITTHGPVNDTIRSLFKELFNIGGNLSDLTLVEGQLKILSVEKLEYLSPPTKSIDERLDLLCHHSIDVKHPFKPFPMKVKPGSA